MRKLFMAAALASALALPAFAKSPFVFFSDEVPQYTGFAAGGFLTNQYALGQWADFEVATLGLEADLEYTLPFALPKNLRLGISERIGYAHSFTKSSATLRRNDDLSFGIGAWVRIPFTAWGQAFAFQPELGYSLILHNSDGQNGSKAHGWYSDQTIVISPALRWIPEILDRRMEVDFSPVYTLSLENDYTLQRLGFRTGVVWHFGKVSAKASEKDKAAEEARAKAEREAAEKEAREKAEQEAREKAEKEAREKAEQEAREKAEQEAREAAESAEARKRLMKETLADGEKALGLDKGVLMDFTPDGDGQNDQLVFKPNFAFMSQPAKEWSLEIADQAGSPFRTIGGQGAMPEAIVWDGRGDDGKLAFSDADYKATLTATLDDKDRETLGTDKAASSAEIKTGTILEKKGDGVWRISVPSLSVFDANAATFNSLSPAQRAQMQKTLDGVVARAQSIEGCHVTVEGYANNISNTQKEHEEDLVPLSQARAESIAELLVQKGLDASRVSAVGRGGENPIAEWSDKANWWKNRRIEFVITR